MLKPCGLGFLLGGYAILAGCGGGSDVDAGYQPVPTAGTGGSSGSTASGGDSSSGSGSSGGGAGGGGGMGPQCPPAGPFDGEIVTAPANEWTWVPVKESLCRDGSESGFGVRLNPSSDKVVLYLEGGGACFNATTCGINPGSFGEVAFGAWKGTAGGTGIFNADSEDNPLRDWNFIYVPYCTGDIHGGAADHVDVPGLTSPKNQSFMGYVNLGHYLKRLVPTFSSASQVLLTGISAGGFGAAYNFDRVAEAFCPVPVTLLDDSGPPMSDTYITPCLQKDWKSLWGLTSTLPAGCPECNGPDGGGIVHYVDYIANKYPNSRLGLISSDKDSVISTFFGFGKNDCKLAVPLSGKEYAAGLQELRDMYLGKAPGWSTYFVSSISHTYLVGPAFYTTEVDGTKLTEWVGTLVNGGTPGHIGP